LRASTSFTAVTSVQAPAEEEKMDCMVGEWRRYMDGRFPN
jgi:hypothetical protein